jgi:hypothetical protein
MKLSIFLPLAAFLTLTAAEPSNINDDISPCLVLHLHDSTYNFMY